MSTARAEARTPEFRIAAVETATSAIGTLTKGCRIIGITKGQFSLLDLIKAVLEQTGPAHLLVSTWTAGIRDAENAGFLLERGELLSMQLLTDRSFPTRQAKYCRRVREIFGDDAITITNVHAKFAVLTNEQWSVTIRSSMNLNRNRRFEQFDLDDDQAIAAFFLGFADECQAANPSGLDARSPEVEGGFDKVLMAKTIGGEVAVRDESEDDLQTRITQLAGLQFSVKEMATLLALSPETVDELETPGTDLFVAIERGRLQVKEDIRRNMLAMAKSGDVKAQAAFGRLADARARSAADAEQSAADAELQRRRRMRIARDKS